MYSSRSYDFKPKQPLHSDIGIFNAECGLTMMACRYLQMSGMILGGMIEADSSMRRYEQQVRMQRMIARDRAMWKDLVDDEDELPSTVTSASKK